MLDTFFYFGADFLENIFLCLYRPKLVRKSIDNSFINTFWEQYPKSILEFHIDTCYIFDAVNYDTYMLPIFKTK